MPEEIARVINTGELFRIQNDLTPVNSYSCKKMSSMVKDHKDSLFKAIEMLICKLALTVNVKYNIEPHQAPDIAQAIYKKYYFYSIEEVALVLRMGSHGELYDERGSGKIYDRLSVDILMTWFKLYDTRLRDTIVENRKKDERSQYESDNIDFFKLPVVAKAVDELIKSLDFDDEKEQQYKRFRSEFVKNRIEIEKSIKEEFNDVGKNKKAE